MKVRYRKGIANHPDPESCGGVREGATEALTEESAGQPLSREIKQSGAPTLLSEAEGHTGEGVMREPSKGPARSQTLSMHGNSLHGNWEISSASAELLAAGGSGKADGHKPGIDADEKSDACVVPMKDPNNDAASKLASAEGLEGRRAAKRNVEQAPVPRTQSRTRASMGLDGVRVAARAHKAAGKKVRFTALMHHMTPQLLIDSFMKLKKSAAAGVDGVTWRDYEEGLVERIGRLWEAVQSGRYRALPSRRVYIPKADGKQRPLGIAALEDKIIQQAVVKVLTPIYETDFLGFSYGFRPGRNQHQALDALWVGLHWKRVNWVLDADIKAFFDTVDHDWLLRFLEHRIGDKRVLRLIRKWLTAGVVENGYKTDALVGTPQGAVISPLLANIYLHYVFDLWVQRWRRRDANGDVIVVRYADDSVAGFERKADAHRFLEAFKERLAKFGLALNEEKDACAGIWSLRDPTQYTARSLAAADVRLLGVHARLCDQVGERSIHREAADHCKANARQTQGVATNAEPPQARADPCDRQVVAGRGSGLLQLPRRTWQRPTPERLPKGCCSGLVACSATAWSAWSDALGPIPANRRALPSPRSGTSSVPERALRVMTQGRSRMR